MAFEFKKDEKVSKGVRRIVDRRIEKAIQTLKSGEKTISDPVVHEARKRFKEIRGTLRLVRGEMGKKAFRRENKTFRDAGRSLSEVRDATMLVDRLDDLVVHFGRRRKAKNLVQLRRALLKRQREARAKITGKRKGISSIVQDVKEARKRIKQLPLEGQGWKAIEAGLLKVYEDGKRAMKAAQNEHADKALHEWRKRAKDLRYELELLKSTAPALIEVLAERAHGLADRLGDDHDLAILSKVAREEAGEQSAVEHQLLFALIDERRQTLQREAFSLGKKLYDESARDFIRRIKGCWKRARDKAE
jgi:CHAD domain-containing protein